MVLHPMVCWQESRWDSVPDCFSSQLWQMSSCAVNPAIPLQAPDVHSGLGCLQRRQVDSLPSNHEANAPKGLLC